ncbi:MAG: hypothetical protein AAFP78_00250 [Pseudomonadota bacterium]
MKRLASAVASIALFTGASGAFAADLKTGAAGDWRYEVVSHTSVSGAARVACSVATGPESEPTLFLSFANSGDARPGALSAFVYTRQSTPTNLTPIDAAFMVDFAVGETRAPGKVSVALSADGITAQSEAFPAVEAAKALVKEMKRNDALRLEAEGEVIGAVSLDGFADAYAEVAAACDLDNARFG